MSALVLSAVPSAAAVPAFAGSSTAAIMFILGVMLLLITFRAQRRRRRRRGTRLTSHAARPTAMVPDLRRDNARAFIDAVRENAVSTHLGQQDQFEVIRPATPASANPPAATPAASPAGAGTDTRSTPTRPPASRPPAAAASPLRLVGGSLRHPGGDGPEGIADLTMATAEVRLADLDQHARQIIALLENRVQTLQSMLNTADDRILLLEELVRQADCRAAAERDAPASDRPDHTPFDAEG